MDCQCTKCRVGRKFDSPGKMIFPNPVNPNIFQWDKRVKAVLRTACGCEKTITLEHFIDRIEMQVCRNAFSCTGPEAVKPVSATVSPNVEVHRRTFLFNNTMSDGSYLYVEQVRSQTSTERRLRSRNEVNWSKYMAAQANFDKAQRRIEVLEARAARAKDALDNG